GGSNGLGTVFALNIDGTGFTVLKSLVGASSGANPNAGLVQGSDGTLYGTASVGGTFDHGTVFSLRPDGSGFAVLKHLQGASSGSYPNSALIIGLDGSLYGTTTLREFRDG